MFILYVNHFDLNDLQVIYLIFFAFQSINVCLSTFNPNYLLHDFIFGYSAGIAELGVMIMTAILVTIIMLLGENSSFYGRICVHKVCTCSC